MTHHDQYIHGHGAAVIANHSRRTAENSAGHLLGRLQPGMRVLDVGCGPGTITVGLARRVAPGEVIGLDQEASVLPGHDVAAGAGTADSASAAKPATVRAGLGAVAEAGPKTGEPAAPNLSFVVGDAYELPFEDASFDVVHAHQILHHLSDPVAAIREMARVTRPGGIVSLREADYGAMTWFPDVPGLDAFIDVFRAQGRAGGSDLDAGRKLLSWARAAGLRDIEPGAGTWCFATPAEREFWAGTWAQRVTDSAFADQALDGGLVTRAELERFAAAWRQWGAADDGWFTVLHGQLLATRREVG